MEKLKKFLFALKGLFWKQKVQSALFALGFFLLLSNLFIFVSKNSLSMPFWDEWDVSQEVMKETNWIKIFLYQHNEHRIGVGLALAKTIAGLTNWSQAIEVKIVFLQIVFSCLFLLLVVRRLKRKIQVTDLVIPLVFFNTLQVGNILFPFQLTFVFPLFFLFAGIFALTLKNLKVRNLLLVLFSLLSAFSSFHGLFVTLVFLTFLFLEFFRDGRSNFRIFVLTSLAEILVVVSYFLNYKNNLQTELNVRLGKKTLDFASTLSGGGFFFLDSSGRFLIFQYLILLSIIFFLGWGMFYSFKNKNFSFVHAGFLILLYAFLFLVSITIGRSSFGIGQALETRYLTFTMLFPLGIWLIASEFSKGRYLKIALFLFLALNIFVFSDRYHLMAQKNFILTRRAWQCYQEKNQKDWQDCFNITPLYPDRARLESLLPDVLKFKKLR